MAFRLSGCSPETTLALCAARSWAVYLRCTGCGYEQHFNVDRLGKLGPPAATLGAIAARLKCSQCRGREGLMATNNSARVGGHSA